MVRLAFVTASVAVLLALGQQSGSAAVLAIPANTAWHANAVDAARAGHASAPSQRYIYASNLLDFSPPYVGSIVYFTMGSSGDVAPAGTISGSKTQLTQSGGIVVDGRGEIWAAQADTNKVVGFAPGSKGNVAPNLVISGSNTGLASPVALALDSAGNLYVVNCAQCGFGPPGTTSVEEFAIGSNGNVAPLRTISGDRTQLGLIEGIALDRKGSIYIANSLSSQVTVFDHRAHGNAQPQRVLNAPRVPVGLAIVGSSLFATAVWQGTISRFTRKAAGDASPRSTFAIGWSANPSGQFLGGIAGAPDGTLYVAGFSAPVIAQYSADANGRARPLKEIQGANTGLVFPTFVFVR